MPPNFIDEPPTRFTNTEYLLSRMVVVDGCWEWTRSKLRDGYGQFGSRGKFYLAHRAAYEAFVGPIPVGMKVCHRCDNPPCMNPLHLFLGTHADNMADMTAKGRRARGARLNTKRGDEHWTRKHPERCLRGERHWMHARAV